MSREEINIDKALLAAEGYSQLGMTDEALEELDQLPVHDDLDLVIARVRLPILMRANRWEPAIETAQLLCERDPKEPDHWIHRAFCLHELDRTREARESLKDGPATLLEKAIYHYNLGCYDAVLGDIEEAQAHLRKAFELDSKFREYARTDPDLVSLKGLL